MHATDRLAKLAQIYDDAMERGAGERGSHSASYDGKLRRFDVSLNAYCHDPAAVGATLEEAVLKTQAALFDRLVENVEYYEKRVKASREALKALTELQMAQ